jgi:hypothetical protein
MTLYEASRPEYWNYITARVLPDLAWLRFGSENQTERTFVSRFMGSERNVFRRLHIRAQAVCGDFAILDKLKEDNLVAILERPNLVRDSDFTTLVLEFLANFLGTIPAAKREDAARDFAKRLLRDLASRRLDKLDRDESKDELVEIGRITSEFFRD